MRYCPNCGAVLPDNTVSFCLNCKKEVQGKKESVKSKNKRKKGKRKREGKVLTVVAYDTYYDDILPEDADRIKESKRTDNLGVKIGLLCFAFLLIISTCVVVMVAFL